LTCASLAEDRFGVVQRDIPRILEAFLSFLSAVEEYQVEVNALYVPPTADQVQRLSAKELEEKEMMRVEVDRASDALCIVSDGACSPFLPAAIFFLSVGGISIEGRRCKDCENVWRKVVGIQVSAEDGSQVARVCRL
jgi:hypothetical protein